MDDLRKQQEAGPQRVEKGADLSGSFETQYCDEESHEVIEMQLLSHNEISPQRTSQLPPGPPHLFVCKRARVRCIKLTLIYYHLKMRPWPAQHSGRTYGLEKALNEHLRAVALFVVSTESKLIGIEKRFGPRTLRMCWPSIDVCKVPTVRSYTTGTRGFWP
jgi:hypothetical protein